MDTGLDLVENTGMPIARCSYLSLAQSAVFSYNLLHVYWYWSVANSYFMKLLILFTVFWGVIIFFFYVYMIVKCLLKNEAVISQVNVPLW